MEGKILPNITIGFAILDDCNKDQTALSRSLRFVRPATCCKNCKSFSNNPYHEVDLQYFIIKLNFTFNYISIFIHNRIC